MYVQEDIVGILGVNIRYDRYIYVEWMNECMYGSTYRYCILARRAIKLATKYYFNLRFYIFSYYFSFHFSPRGFSFRINVYAS